MPHSSGGGFHGGGFHSGGGFHGTSSSGGGGTRYSNRPFAGANRYYYYRGRRLRYVYADGPYKKEGTGLVLFIIVFSFLFVFIGLLVPGIKDFNNEKINSKSDIGIVIEDNANILKETDELYEAFEDFYDETGIIPALVTVNHSDWKHIKSGNTSGTLSRYSYSAYTKRFKDEYHWLIVYSIDDEGTEGFAWEGMQGNDTDPVLTKGAADAFGRRLHKNFESGEYSVEESLVDAFEYLTPRILRGFWDIDILGPALVVIVFGSIIFVVLAIVLTKDKKYKKAEKWEPWYKEAVCEECGRPVVKGAMSDCPFCGAYVPRI